MLKCITDRHRSVLTRFFAKSPPSSLVSFLPTISFSFSSFPKFFCLSTEISLYLKPLPLSLFIQKSTSKMRIINFVVTRFGFGFESQLGFWIFVISICRYISISPSVLLPMFVYFWLCLCIFTYVCLCLYMFVYVCDFEFDSFFWVRF